MDTDDVLSSKEAIEALALTTVLGDLGRGQAPLHSLLDVNPDLSRRLDVSFQ